MTTQIKDADKIRGEIYKLVDSFLVESKNQDGVERSLERLNQDRHLFVDNMEKVMREYTLPSEEAIEEWLKEVRSEISSVDSHYINVITVDGDTVAQGIVRRLLPKLLEKLK